MITAARSLRVVRLGYAYMGLNLKTIYREPAALFFVVVVPDHVPGHLLVVADVRDPDPRRRRRAPCRW